MDKYKSNRHEHVNAAYDTNLDEPPHYEEASRAVRPSVVSAFGHDTLDRVPNIDFYRNAGSVSGHRAVRPSLQELHDVFQKVSELSLSLTSPPAESYTWFGLNVPNSTLVLSNQVKEVTLQSLQDHHRKFRE